MPSTNSTIENSGLISILMPFKNTEKYLQECLDSILAQSYTHWELLAINDHSTDGSLEIAKAYARQDSRIRVLSNQGHGIIPALRLGYSQAQGTWISRMDSDDRMTPCKLSELLKNLIRGGRGSVSTGLVSYFSDQPLGAGYKRYEEWINGISLAENNLEDIYRECVFPSPCWMIHREDLDKCGAFDSDIYPEDYDLCFRFYREKFKAVSSKHLLHYWRDYAERASRTDPHYQDHQHYQLKVHYFLQLECDSSSHIVLWSAGKKSKELSKHLIERAIDFTWVCTNEKKIGNKIAGYQIQNYQMVKNVTNPRILIPIVGEKYQIMVREFLKSIGLQEHREFFFVY